MHRRATVRFMFLFTLLLLLYKAYDILYITLRVLHERVFTDLDASLCSISKIIDKINILRLPTLKV